MSLKMLANPTGITHTNLSVRIQRVKHRGRRQEVPVTQIFSAALLEPKLLRFGEYPVAVFPARIGDIFTLPPQCGAQRPDGRSDPEGRRLLDILHHHHHNTNSPFLHPIHKTIKRTDSGGDAQTSQRTQFHRRRRRQR